MNKLSVLADALSEANCLAEHDLRVIVEMVASELREIEAGELDARL